MFKRKFPTPVVVLSKCLEIDACRYNGKLIQNEFVRKLSRHISFVPVCPEVEIGLGVPRDPIRILDTKEGLQLIQPATGSNFTLKMTQFANFFLTHLGEIDAFILKRASPSCGIKDVNIFSRADDAETNKRGSGFFASAVLEKYPLLAVESEQSLLDPQIKEHFLIKLFTLAAFRETKRSKSMSDLVQFHSENKLLLMGYNQKQLRILGNLVAHLGNKRSFHEIIGQYEKHLALCLEKYRRRNSTINVLMHAFGYSSDKLSHEEKTGFLDMLAKYRTGRESLGNCQNLLKEWIERFNESYLLRQTFFEPFPQDLLSGSHLESEK